MSGCSAGYRVRGKQSMTIMRSELALVKTTCTFLNTRYSHGNVEAELTSPPHHHERLPLYVYRRNKSIFLSPLNLFDDNTYSMYFFNKK